MRLRKSILPILSALVLLAVGASAGSNPPPTEKDNSLTSEQKNSGYRLTNLESDPSATVTPATPSDGASRKTEKDADASWYDRPRALLIVTTLYVLVSIGLLKVSNKAANAAKQSADTAGRALANLERPWISLGDVFPKEVGLDPSNHLVIEVPFDLVNSGRSPALIVSQIAGTRLSTNTADLLAQPDYPAPEPSHSILGTSAKSSAVVSIRVHESQVENFYEEKLTFIFFGQILYRAAYDKQTDPLHEYRWCLFYKRPFQYRVSGAERPGYFYFAGPPAWNGST